MFFEQHAQHCSTLRKHCLTLLLSIQNHQTAAIGEFRKSILALLIRSRVVTEPHNLKCLKCADNVRSMSRARRQADLMFSCM